MDVHAAIGDERMLRRVIALIAALAVLAERVATRSPWVRWFVLCILRRAEAVVVAFAFEHAGMPLAPEEMPAAGHGREDALRLAARLRALAAMLCALLSAACPFGGRVARRGFGHLAPGAGRRARGGTTEPNDTS